MLCTIISLSIDNEFVSNIIIDILNVIPNGEKLDMESYKLLVNAFLVPIKEAILTYIIFDTVADDKKKRCTQNEQENKK